MYKKRKYLYALFAFMIAALICIPQALQMRTQAAAKPGTVRLSSIKATDYNKCILFVVTVDVLAAFKFLWRINIFGLFCYLPYLRIFYHRLLRMQSLHQPSRFQLLNFQTCLHQLLSCLLLTYQQPLQLLCPCLSRLHR